MSPYWSNGFGDCTTRNQKIIAVSFCKPNTWETNPFPSAKGKLGLSFGEAFYRSEINSSGGVTFSLGNGKSILFWEDVWIGDTPLRLEFPRLYDYCYNKTSLVSDCWVDGEWRIDFRRSLDPSDLTQWDHLLRVLAQTSISDTEDKVRWALEKKGVFSTRSMYHFLSDRGVLNGRMQRLWKSKLPMKIKVFLWLAFQDRLPTGIVLKRRNWKGDDRCVVCKVIETSNHIFSTAP